MAKRLFLAAFLSTLVLAACPQAPVEAVLPAAHRTSASIERSRPPRGLANAIVCQARQQALAMCSVGLCYRGVKRALSSLGIGLSGTAAWMARDQLARDKRFAVVPVSRLKAGDILVHGKSRCHPYGHIAVYLGNGQEASDHVQKLVLGGRYGATVVFRVRSAVELAATAAHRRRSSTADGGQTIISSRN